MSDVLDRVLSLARDRVRNGEVEMVQEFARAYLHRPGGKVAAPDGVAPEALLAEVLGAFGLAAGRGRADAAVRAFTPTAGEHGYATQGSVLETNTRDLPFLVDSVVAELRSRGWTIRRVVHPIVGTERDADGRLTSIVHPREAPARESVMHFEIDRRLAPEELAALEDAVRDVLGAVHRVVDDFPAMTAAAAAMAEQAAQVPDLDPRDAAEIADFMQWLSRDHFVFLGYREYEVADGTLSVRPGSGLGLLADCDGSAFAEPVALAELDPVLRDHLTSGETLIVGKTNRPSPVHKRARMDVVGLRRPLPGGTGGAEARLVGMFTTRAYAEPASTTPVLHRKLARILEAEDLIEGSHDFKAAVQLFDSFPKDELFAAPVEDLRGAVVALLALQGDDVRLLSRTAADGRGAALIASLPRSRHSSRLRDRLRATVQTAYGAAGVDLHEVLGEGDRVQIHFSVHDPGGLPAVDPRELESRVRTLARTWDDLATGELVAAAGPERGRMLAARWLARLPEAYRAATEPSAAAQDVQAFEALVTGADAFAVGLQDEQTADGTRRTRVALYTRGPKVELSRATPMLEDLGLRVIEELPTRLEHHEELWLQAFAVLGPADQPLDLGVCGDRVADCLVAVWRGEVESDSLNRLVVSAGLTPGQIQVLRAYRRYRQRIGSRYTEGFQNDVIAANPGLTADLMSLFELRFDPCRPRDEQAESALREEILAGLEAVELLDHDRILRNQLGLIDATVRTNVYLPGRETMSFKLRSAEVPAIPQPAPLFEIYVYAPDMEGIHLRGGRIARGGLRWSDRMDYRTEVYGLLRAQMTKNAVIVPSGAKGGFFLKQLPGGEPDVRRQYTRYVTALLELTDNLVDGEVVPPDGVRVLDEDDTYLVVAADKGTSTFSDIANAVALKRGFWLGDAFASGGSTGYDHKALGITARGAWESVKRHFRELGLDPEAGAITVIGIGDMSGDVFGNGMLLSSSIKLVAAYDHRHIFLDPDPDPAAAHAERRRLFGLPASSWGDYDLGAISAGGGVFSRAAKRIDLSPEACERLGIEEESLAPNDLIRAILRAPADLLFNGGIGTVVKASTESDADAQDRSSDAIRVDARDVRARVVGEGGNLGFTQRARIELAGRGCRINADFIDNCAGVDCSDHEVNLKVLLDLAVRRSELDREERDALLERVTLDVTAHVLRNAFLQARALARETTAAPERIFESEDLMESLEGEGLLDRESEALPGTEELSDRRRAGQGLRRPEIAVLLAYAKRSLTDAVLASDLVEDPRLEAELRSYFPPEVIEGFGHLVALHPLRRELAATLVGNDIVDALGPTYVSSLVAERGSEPADVVRAYRIALEVTGARERWAAVEALAGSVPYEVELELMEGVETLVGDVTRWYAGRLPPGGLTEAIEASAPGFAVLAGGLAGLRSPEWHEERDHEAARLFDRGVPASLAAKHALQPALVHAPDILLVAAETGRDVLDVARAFFRIGEGLGLEWLEREVDAAPATGRLQRWAGRAVRDDVLAARRILAEHALAEAPDATGEEAVERFLLAREHARRRLTLFTRALAQEGRTDLAALTLAVRHLRALAEEGVA